MLKKDFVFDLQRFDTYFNEAGSIYVTIDGNDSGGGSFSAMTATTLSESN